MFLGLFKVRYLFVTFRFCSEEKAKKKRRSNGKLTGN